MCLACLNVSTQPCAHRWYQLVRPCQPETHLANCGSKLQLQGWEARHSHCPFCNPSTAREAVHESTHRLFGTSPPDQPTSRPTTTTATPPDAAALPFSPLSRHSSASSTSSGSSSEREQRRGRHSRDMNARLAVYLTAHPHEVLPSARKNAPTYPQLQPEALQRVESLPFLGGGGDTDRDSVTSGPLVRTGSLVSKRVRKGMRLSREWFGGLGGGGGG